MKLSALLVPRIDVHHSLCQFGGIMPPRLLCVDQICGTHAVCIVYPRYDHFRIPVCWLLHLQVVVHQNVIKEILAYVLGERPHVVHRIIAVRLTKLQI